MIRKPVWGQLAFLIGMDTPLKTRTPPKLVVCQLWRFSMFLFSFSGEPAVGFRGCMCLPQIY